MASAIANILCPTDFSEGARRALSHAVALASPTGAHLTVAHAWGSAPPASLFGDAGAAAVLHPERRDEEVERLNASVAAFRAQGAKISTVALEGAPVPVLLSFIEEEGIDLLVLGTHGRSGFERLVLGSVTEKLLRKAPCPVLTIPANVEGGEPRPRFSRVLCAVDHVAPHDATIATALWLARQHHGQVTLLHVVEPLLPAPGLGGDFDSTAYTDRVAEDWLSALRGCVDPETRVACQVTERVVVGKPSRTIVDSAAQLGADVVVMGVHGRGALDLLLLGSTTHAVVRHARCPVLTVRVPD